MDSFVEKVAIITGAASGIGRALAQRCVQAKMKVVLADIEEQALAQTTQTLREQGATVLSICTDVAQADAIEQVAARTLATFGAVHLLCNNAKEIILPTRVLLKPLYAAYTHEQHKQVFAWRSSL